MSKISLEGEKSHFGKFLELLKMNGYVSELLFYNSTQRELSHAGLQPA